MLYGFFFRSNKTLYLMNKTNIDSNLPLYCSKKSEQYPHLLQEIDKVYPLIKEVGYKSDKIHTYTPLFLIIDEDGVKEIPSSKFCLMLYPNKENNENFSPLTSEYIKSIEPMVLCCDVSGYYLGCLNNDNMLFFEKCNEEEHEYWIQLSNSQNLNLYYTNVNFNPEKIYLKKV